jgi:hypothetical protein
MLRRNLAAVVHSDSELVNVSKDALRFQKDAFKSQGTNNVFSPYSCLITYH